jgi:predicted transcriptional regulator
MFLSVTLEAVVKLSGRKPNRDKLTIIYEILVCCGAKTMRPSHIARKAKVNVCNVPFYSMVPGLVSSGLIAKLEYEGKTVYSIISEGRDWIRQYVDLLGKVKSCLINSGDWAILRKTN